MDHMLEQYETLKTLSLIAEESNKPTLYQCTPHELILRSKADWDKINRDLQTLESESLVQISRGGIPLFSITPKGIQKVLSLEGKAYKWNKL